jgi:hypothetical protein
MIRKYALVITGILALSTFAKAQITITAADMPNPKDSVLISIATTIGSNDVKLTGASFSWDYSKLAPVLQRYELFDAPSTFTSPFNLLFNPFNTSYGKNNYQVKTVPLPGMKIDAAYDFFKESTADFRQIGAGYTINGTPIPFLYSPNDIIYRFPMNYLNVDSCDYKYGLPIPGMGYYGQKGHRVNTVDGWGTLITPFGSFTTIRVLSAITATDTIYVEAFKTGTNIPRPLKHEYKWFAQNSKIPVLQIDGNVAAGTVTVTNVQFIDSLRSNIPHVGITDIASNQSKFEVYPNPATDFCMIRYLTKKNASVNISVMDITGKLLFSKMETRTAGEQLLPLQTSDFPNGIYFIRLECEHFSSVQKLVISR